MTRSIHATRRLALAAGLACLAAPALVSAQASAWPGKPVTIVEARRRPGLGDLLFGALAPKGVEGAATHLFTNSTGPRFLYYWEGGR